MVYRILCKRFRQLGIEPLIHASFWVFFISGEIYSLALLTGRYNSIEHYAVFYPLNIILFYSYVYLLFKIPRKAKFGYLWGILIFLFEIFIYVLFAGFLTRALSSISNDGDLIVKLNEKFYVSTIWRALYFMFFATGYFLVKRNAKFREIELNQEVKLEKLKHQLVTVEKDYLRAQINPHLLFNTISFIKHAIKHHPENAEEALMLLSDIMDYALGSSNGALVPLSEEVEQIQNMIRLNQLRYNEKLNIRMEISADTDHVTIEPIILLTLTENIFKHGNLLNKEFPAIIEIACQEKLIQFKTSNLISNNKASKGRETGLSNIRSRLENLYPGRYTFQYGLQGDVFTTMLNLKLP